ncbi:MAG: hypothetical protein ABFR50_01640 [Candidatus Fermentibacteria bacterium]
MKRISVLSVLLFALAVSTGFSEEEIMADESGTSVALPSSLDGIWVNPTDNTMENGLAVLSAPWPNYSGSLITYINLYDPAYGLDPNTSYRLTSVEFCIKDRGNQYGVESSRVIIQEWFEGAPTETNLFNEEFDASNWGYPPDYSWTDPISIIDSTVVLPAEFAIGWHILWPSAGAFADYYLGLDTDAPQGNYYFYNGQWCSMTPYDGAFGVRFEVEVYGSSSLQSATFAEIKALFR